MWLCFEDTCCINANCGYRKQCKLSVTEIQSSLYKLYIFRLHLRINQSQSPCFSLTQFLATKLDHILRCRKMWLKMQTMFRDAMLTQNAVPLYHVIYCDNAKHSVNNTYFRYMMVDNTSSEISVAVWMLPLENETFGCCRSRSLKISLHNTIKELLLPILEGYVTVFYFLVTWYAYG